MITHLYRNSLIITLQRKMQSYNLLHLALQANTSVSDADKEERKALERKFEEMEEQLKVANVFLLGLKPLNERLM